MSIPHPPSRDVWYGNSFITTSTEEIADNGYQLLQDIQESEASQMQTNNETSAAPRESPLYGEGGIIKIDDAIKAIGMGKWVLLAHYKFAFSTHDPHLKHA